jgi:hypothetical protein
MNARAAVAIGLGLFAAVSVARAAQPTDARAFVSWVFSHYPRRTASRFDPIGRSSGAVFDPAMIALLKENDRLTPKGDEGALDGDPICDCQDDGGLAVRRMTVVSSNAVDASATVEFVLAAGDKRTERLDLVLVGGVWRIHDIHTKDTPSLRAYLTDANRELLTPHR